LSIHARRSPARGEIHGELRSPDPPAEHARDAGLLRVILENVRITIWAIDREGVFTFTGGKGMESTGHEPGRYVGKSLYDMFAKNPETRNVRKALTSGERIHSYGDAYGMSWEHWYIPRLGPEGAVESLVGVSMNLDEAKRAEKELVEKTALIE